MPCVSGEEGNPELIQRTSTVARFDTVVFNPRTRVLGVWRYSTGTYEGTHTTIFSIGPIGWIEFKRDLRQLAWVVGQVASLQCYSEENDLPEPWWGFRFR